MRFKVARHFVLVCCLGWLPVPAFAAPQAAAMTVKAFCDGLADATGGNGAGGSDQARQRRRQQCIELLNSGLSQKRLTFSQTAAATCLKSARETDAAASPNSASLVGPCTQVVTGLQGQGAACESTLDCRSALVCRGARGGPPGTCQGPLKEGDPCDEEQLGASGFYALVTAGRGVCGPKARCQSEAQVLRCVAK